MRTESIAFFLLFMITSSATGEEAFRIFENNLTDSYVESLSAPIFTKQILDIDDKKILAVTRDYGFGLEIRDASIYIFRKGKWELIFFIRTDTSKITMRYASGNIELLSKTGKLLALVPKRSFDTTFDTQEH